VYQNAQIEAAKRTEAALAENIRETARRLAEQQKATQDAEAQTTKARAAAGAAAVAADRLRERLNALRSASAPAGNSPTTGAGTTDRLADVLVQCSTQYRDVAASADAAIIAGRACEASYNALTK
jgi:chromosome segregation ATPase